MFGGVVEVMIAGGLSGGVIPNTDIAEGSVGGLSGLGGFVGNLPFCPNLLAMAERPSPATCSSVRSDRTVWIKNYSRKSLNLPFWWRIRHVLTLHVVAFEHPYAAYP